MFLTKIHGGGAGDRKKKLLKKQKKGKALLEGPNSLVE